MDCAPLLSLKQRTNPPPSPRKSPALAAGAFSSGIHSIAPFPGSRWGSEPQTLPQDPQALQQLHGLRMRDPPAGIWDSPAKPPCPCGERGKQLGEPPGVPRSSGTATSPGQLWRSGPCPAQPHLGSLCVPTGHPKPVTAGGEGSRDPRRARVPCGPRALGSPPAPDGSLWSGGSK